jgi:hypothetical protein
MSISSALISDISHIAHHQESSSPPYSSVSSSSITRKRQQQIEREKQAQLQQHLSSLSLAERTEFLRQQEESAASKFLFTLPDEINPISNRFLQNLIHLEMPTQAFSKLKPTSSSSSGGTTTNTKNNNHNNNSSSSIGLVPICHYPATRDAILSLLGPESEAGTFPSSLLSAPLTTRLGVTVSNNNVPVAPDRSIGNRNEKISLSHQNKSKNENQQHQQEQQNDATAMMEMKNKKLLLLSKIAAAKNSSASSFANPTLTHNFLDLTADFVPSSDDDEENDYVAINPDGTINFEESSPNSSSTKEGKRQISLSNLPSGADLEAFPPVLRDGIRRAAIEIMQRHLGPRMNFLISRQRRLAIMGQEIDFSNGGIIIKKEIHQQKQQQQQNQRNRGMTISNLKMMNNNSRGRSIISSTKTSSKNSISNNNNNEMENNVQILAVSQIARNYSLTQVQQLVSDTMRRTCAPLQFLMPSSSNISASTTTTSSLQPPHIPLDPKFPSGVHFPLCHELTSNSQLNQFLSPTEKLHFASSSSPYSPTASFFAHWSTEAMHRIIGHGFLQIVPAGVQLCYQGAPVAVTKHSDTPSVYVILAGTCEAVFSSGSSNNVSDFILPSGDARLSCSRDVFPPCSSTSSNVGFSKKTTHENNDDDDTNNSKEGGAEDAGKMGGNLQRKESLVSRRKSFSMMISPSQLNQNNNNIQSNENNNMNFAQKKLIAWESFFKSKKEGQQPSPHSSSIGTGIESNNHSSGELISLSATHQQLQNVLSGSSTSNDIRLLESVLFPLTSNKTQLLNSVVSTTPFLVNDQQQQVQNQKSKIQNKNNNFRNLIGPMTALGPFGLSMTSAVSGKHSIPHPCSLRSLTKCEIFVIPFWAIAETLKSGNYYSSSSSTTAAAAAVGAPTTTILTNPNDAKDSSSQKFSPSDADHILYAAACHQFALSFYSTCCSRMLRKIPWLLKPLSLSSSLIAIAMAGQHQQQQQQRNHNKNEASNSGFLFSKELRSCIAAAFRPVLISQDKISQFRSSMALSGNSSSSSKDHGNGGTGKNNNNLQDNNHHDGNHSNNTHSSSSSFVDPLGFLILPQVGSRARVQLSEASHAAEAAVVTVDALEPKTESSKKLTSFAQVAQSRLRNGNGFEFSCRIRFLSYYDFCSVIAKSWI